MIIIRLEKIDDFVSFLNRRIGDEILYEFVENPSNLGSCVILYYLARIDTLNVIYQMELEFPNVRDREAIKQKLNEIEFGEIRLIPGRLREVYFSIS